MFPPIPVRMARTYLARIFILDAHFSHSSFQQWRNLWPLALNYKILYLLLLMLPYLNHGIVPFLFPLGALLSIIIWLSMMYCMIASTFSHHLMWLTFNGKLSNIIFVLTSILLLMVFPAPLTPATYFSRVIFPERHFVVDLI